MSLEGERVVTEGIVGIRGWRAVPVHPESNQNGLARTNDASRAAPRTHSGSSEAPIGIYFRLPPPVSYMSEFRVRGRYQARDGWQAFEKTVEAPNEDVARERAYAELGSNYGLKRTQIDLEGVEA